MKDLAYTLAWTVKTTSSRNLAIGFLVSATAIFGVFALAAKFLQHTHF